MSEQRGDDSASDETATGSEPQHATNQTGRTTRDVLESHLALRQAGDLEADLRVNYADDVVMLSWGEGVNHGHDGVRRLATVLRTYVEHGSFTYHRLITDQEYGLLRWSANVPGMVIHDGTDSFVVRSGRIVAQTIAYTAERD